MPPRTSELLKDIDAFLELTGMKPTNLGLAAINDPMLYGDLKRGRRLWDETEQKVRGFMRMYAAVKKLSV